MIVEKIWLRWMLCFHQFDSLSAAERGRAGTSWRRPCTSSALTRSSVASRRTNAGVASFTSASPRHFSPE